MDVMEVLTNLGYRLSSFAMSLRLVDVRIFW